MDEVGLIFLFFLFGFVLGLLICWAMIDCIFLEKRDDKIIDISMRCTHKFIYEKWLECGPDYVFEFLEREYKKNYGGKEDE